MYHVPIKWIRGLRAVSHYWSDTKHTYHMYYDRDKNSNLFWRQHLQIEQMGLQSPLFYYVTFLYDPNIFKLKAFDHGTRCCSARCSPLLNAKLLKHTRMVRADDTLFLDPSCMRFRPKPKSSSAVKKARRDGARRGEAIRVEHQYELAMLIGHVKHRRGAQFGCGLTDGWDQSSVCTFIVLLVICKAHHGNGFFADDMLIWAICFVLDDLPAIAPIMITSHQHDGSTFIDSSYRVSLQQTNNAPTEAVYCE